MPGAALWLGAGPLRLVLVLVLVAAVGCGKNEGRTGVSAPAPGTTPGTVAADAGATAADPSPHFESAARALDAPFAGLKAPRAVSVDDSGRVWVMDFGHARIRVYDAKGAVFGGWGGPGTGIYALRDPCGLAVRGSDVYVADTWLNGLEKFSTAGQFSGKSKADLYGPRAVAAPAGGQVWVSDTGNGRVIVSDGDLSNPRTIGKKGSGDEEFQAPFGLAAGPSGNVYVCDEGNGRIQVLDRQGRFVRRFKFAGWGPNAETYIDVDTDETLYVSDSNAGAVVRLDKNGRVLRRYTEDDRKKKFFRPTGVAIDRKNRILYVVSTDTNSVSTIHLEK